MERGILLTNTSRKREKYIIGGLSLIILTIIGIYASNLEEHTFFSYYICPFITAIVGAIGLNVCID